MTQSARMAAAAHAAIVKQLCGTIHGMSSARTLSRLTLIASLAVCAACASRSPIVTTTTGLRYQVIVPGNGPAAQPGQSVRIHETTTLPDGIVIYSSRTKNTPVTFLLGGNQVIAGVDEGVTGMKVGEHRKLVVPASLSRRSVYPPNTPPDSTLYIDVELLEIRPK